MLSYMFKNFFLLNFWALDPLEQFENIYLLNNQYNCPTVLTTFSTVSIILSLVLVMSTTRTFSITTQNALDLFFLTIFNFVKLAVKDNSQTKKLTHLSSFFFIFMTLVFINVSGLIPYSWTMTSWFTPILLIGMSYLFQINIHVILRKKYLFFEQFVPAGTPLVIIPFLTIIEIISYLSRVISLSVRLFANMLSGHALLKILISFSWSTALSLTSWGLLISFVIWTGVTAIFVLEVMVAFLQAYVFTLLLNIYLNDAFTEGH